MRLPERRVTFRRLLNPGQRSVGLSSRWTVALAKRAKSRCEMNLDRNLADAEAWAKDHVHFVFGPTSGKRGVTWIAQIHRNGLLFERRASGQVGRRESLRRRAANEVVRDYLEWVRRQALSEPKDG